MIANHMTIPNAIITSSFHRNLSVINGSVSSLYVTNPIISTISIAIIGSLSGIHKPICYCLGQTRIGL